MSRKGHLFGAWIASQTWGKEIAMSLARDVELAKQRMLQVQEALLAYPEANDRDAARHKQLIQELQQATKDFVDRVERLAHLQAPCST